MAEAIDKKFLAGLTFRTSNAKKVQGEDGTKVQHVPVERPLKPADVLDWVEKDDTVVIVAADGRKHEVSKKAAEKADKAQTE